MKKEEKLFALISKLNVKYWHLPFGDTTLWDPKDRELLEKAKKLSTELELAKSNS